MYKCLRVLNYLSTRTQKGNLFKFQNQNFFKKTTTKMRTRNFNFYEVLGVDKTCTNEEIRAAYIKLAKQYHPDVNKDPGSDDKFKTITLAYEALSIQKNRDLYDAYMYNDPYSQEWKYKEEDYRDEENSNSSKNFYRERARYDKYTQNNYKNKSESNFWNDHNSRDDFESEFYKDYENIFNKGASGFSKSTKQQKAEDILLEIQISLYDSFHGIPKKINFTRTEKCKLCHGTRSSPGQRPSKCFSCNGSGEVRTAVFNSKKCNQCKGSGFIIKYPCK